MTEATPDPFQAAYAALMPILGELVSSQINGPKENARKLRSAVDDALCKRIGHLERRLTRDIHLDALEPNQQQLRRSELIRLRTFYNLLPHLEEPALRYILGSVEVDGRINDYVQPESLTLHPDPDARLPEADRISAAIGWAVETIRVMGQDSGHHETVTLFVARPAASPAAAVLESLSTGVTLGVRLSVTIVPNVKTDSDPWAIRDLLIVNPKSQAA